MYYFLKSVYGSCPEEREGYRRCGPVRLPKKTQAFKRSGKQTGALLLQLRAGLRDYKWNRERTVRDNLRELKMAQTIFPQSLGLKKI
jgi:hypothetical protein